VTDLLRRVAAADPTAPAPLDDTARAALATILTEPPAAPSPARRRRRPAPAGRRAGRLALAGTLAVTGVVAYLVAVPGRDTVRPRPAATAFPPPPATAEQPLPYGDPGEPAGPYLRDLAEKAERQPRHAPGTYDYVRTRAWSLPRGGPEVTRERWLAADGSGAVGVKRFGPGGLDGELVAPLPTEPDALRDRLARDSRSPMVLVGVAFEWTSTVVEPDEAAAMLRLLADQPAVLYRGGVTDRAGRLGLVFTTEEDASVRRVVVLDPVTGALLSEERVVVDPGRLNSGRGAVDLLRDREDLTSPFTLSYTLVVASGRTAAPDQAP
jgi:hypothetical protein